MFATPHHTIARLGRVALILIVPLITALLPALPARAAEWTLAVIPSAASLPIRVAETQGFFKAEGIDLQVVDCSSGPVCLRQVFGKRAQMTAVTELPEVIASFERRDFAIIGTLATVNGNVRLMGRKSAGITKADDLRHKRIGVVVGTSAHYYLDVYLLYHGIDPKEVSIVPLLADYVASAVAQRQVDAVAVFNRLARVVSKALENDATLLDDPRIYTEAYNLVIDRAVLAERPGEVVKVLRALARAERFIAEQPLQAREILRTRSGFDAANAAIFGATVSYRLGLDQSLLSAMEGEARWAVREGHVAAGSRIPNYLDFIDHGPLDAAMPAASTR